MARRRWKHWRRAAVERDGELTLDDTLALPARTQMTTSCTQTFILSQASRRPPVVARRRRRRRPDRGRLLRTSTVVAANPSLRAADGRNRACAMTAGVKPALFLPALSASADVVGHRRRRRRVHRERRLPGRRATRARAAARRHGWSASGAREHPPSAAHDFTSADDDLHRGPVPPGARLSGMTAQWWRSSQGRDASERIANMVDCAADTTNAKRSEH